MLRHLSDKGESWEVSQQCDRERDGSDLFELEILKARPTYSQSRVRLRAHFYNPNTFPLSGD